MKLFYDNFIAFMPIGRTTDDEGKVIPDAKLEAARNAMIMLADFQNNHNINALYESIRQISVYAGMDIVDLMLSLGDIEVGAGTIEGLLDVAAKNLFKTVSPDYPQNSFDYKYYTAILLSVTHTIIVMQNQNTDEGDDDNKPKDEQKDSAESTDKPQ